MAITIPAMKWVPPFARGQVRDVRVRWVLKEAGWPYDVRLVDAPTLATSEYRAKQPFGQVPYLEEDGRPPLFESGAIALDVAMRAGRLIPADGPARSQVLTWAIAALSTVEPALMNVAEVEYFLEDEEDKARRRPLVTAAARRRLGELQDALGERRWLAGDEFSVADLLMAAVLGIGERLGLLDDAPALAAYLARCRDRPAWREAEAEQRAVFAAHSPADMRFGESD